MERSRSRSAGRNRVRGAAPRPGAPLRKRLGPFGGPPTSEKVVSATLYNTQLNFTRGTVALFRLPDVVAVDGPQLFTTMTPPRAGFGTGSNTLRSLGVEQAQASVAATVTDPFQRNFWGCKIDHPGWSATNVPQWNANITQFAYVKTSAVVLEITMPDPPMASSEAVKMIRPGSMTTLQESQTQTVRFGAPNVSREIWDEIRPAGAWQYMVIPAQKDASLNLTNIVGLARWQQLLQLGYKPRICKGRKYSVMCMPRGFDAAGSADIGQKLNILSAGAGTIPASNGFNGPPPGQARLHKAQETDWCVQYNNSAANPDTYVGALGKWNDFTESGFDVIAFGSAIVFQFCQYCPPTSDGAFASTAAVQLVPITLTVHNKTVFSQLKTAARDLGQVFTMPVIGGV